MTQGPQIWPGREQEWEYSSDNRMAGWTASIGTIKSLPAFFVGCLSGLNILQTVKYSIVEIVYFNFQTKALHSLISSQFQPKRNKMDKRHTR